MVESCYSSGHGTYFNGSYVVSGFLLTDPTGAVNWHRRERLRSLNDRAIVFQRNPQSFLWGVCGGGFWWWGLGVFFFYNFRKNRTKSTNPDSASSTMKKEPPLDESWLVSSGGMAVSLRVKADKRGAHQKATWYWRRVSVSLEVCRDSTSST